MSTGLIRILNDGLKYGEETLCRTRAEWVKEWISTLGHGAENYPFSATITAIFFTFLGLTVANWGFNQCPIPCIRRHGIRTAELFLVAGLTWIVHRAFQSICKNRESPHTTAKKIAE
jgi:hypothetical protein